LQIDLQGNLCWNFVKMASLVAIDDAESNNDGHAAEAKQRQDKPAILEATRHDVAKEQWGIAGAARTLLAF